jgi:glutamyl-tRNA reductase
MVDIAVPRDIEAQVGDLRDVYLYSVDDLREIIDQNLRSRRSEASKADEIIAEGVLRYLEERRSLAAVDLVKEYRQMAEQLREQELQRALRGLSRGDDPGQALAQLARGLTNKLIHAPTAGLKQASIDGRQDLLDNARKLLGVEEAEPAAAQTASDESASDESASDESASDESAEFDLAPTAPTTDTRTLQ